MVDIEHTLKMLKARQVGSGWVAGCPAHTDTNPSLSIHVSTDHKLLLHCHAGCGQTRVIDALRSLGIWHDKQVHREAADPEPSSLGTLPSRRLDQPFDPLYTWQTARSACGTLAERYLRGRSITLPVPASLRFRPRLRHRSGGYWPAMIACVTHGRVGHSIGIHRTFLAPDGSGKAPVPHPKMMLGPCAGGVARLGPETHPLLIGEGIETCLSAIQATGLTAWAALSSSGLRSLDLPPSVQKVVILVDADAAGEAAAHAAAERWVRQGVAVSLARPPKGLDFNDLISR